MNTWDDEHLEPEEKYFDAEMYPAPDEHAQVSNYADPAMFTAVPIAEKGEPVKPTVSLVSMTANPLRVMAAMNGIYQGRPINDPTTMSKADCMAAFKAVTRNALEAPLEFIDLHFLISGVTRAFTHQLVRQRTAVYGQESLRFAVKENAAMEVGLPPSLEVLADDAPARTVWNDTVARIGWAYNALIDAGIPAEDARGLLPTNIATRLHYKTNLRNLAEHSGLRLCSQAQYEWKLVWAEILKAIRSYGPIEDRWQQMVISSLFKPICYQTGKCEFMADTDRWCVIRDRVQAHHAAGEGPELWTDIDPTAPLHYMAARDPRA
jgi:flavin-dependent thymidylate synthase